MLARTGTGSGISTAHIERLNAPFRASRTGLVRWGRALWREQGRLQAEMYLVGCTSNRCGEHDSLRMAAPEGSAREWLGRTPAMAARLTDHVWDLGELLGWRVVPAVWKTPRVKRRRRQQATPAPTVCAA